MMPLPLKRLYSVGGWLEKNANEVIRETIAGMKEKNPPNPITLVSRVLARVDVSQLLCDIFSMPKDPETGKQLNPDLTKGFFDEYLDVPTGHKLFLDFVEINDVEQLIKNLQSLPAVKRLMEAGSLAFGIPFLNTLQQNTDSAQMKSEGSPSPRSIDTLQQATIERQGLGKSDLQPTEVIADKQRLVM